MSTASNEPLSIQAGTKLAPSQSIAGFFADPANAHGVATNIDATGDAGLAMVMKCTSVASVPSEELEKLPFPMKYYYAHAVELQDQRTGEVNDRVRIVLVSPEGETTSFASQGVLDSLDIIRRFKGDGPYHPPIRLKAVRVKTRKGNTVTKLELDLGDPTKAAASDGGGKKS